MSLPSLTVKYASTYAGLAAGTSVQNVQQVTINQGRRAQLEQYRAGSATIVLRYPSGFASPVAAFVPGQIIGVYDSSAVISGFELFIGRIADVNVDYGIPYFGTTGPADYCTLECESRYAEFGRLQGLGYSMAAGGGTAQLAACETQTGYNIDKVAKCVKLSDTIVEEIKQFYQWHTISNPTFDIDVDATYFDKDKFLTQIQDLYDWLGYDDFNETLLSQYYAAYIDLHKT